MRKNRDDGTLMAFLCLILAIFAILAGAAGREARREREPDHEETQVTTVAVNPAERYEASPFVIEPLLSVADHIDVIKPSKNQIAIWQIESDEPITETVTLAGTASQTVSQAVSNDTDPAIVLAQMVYGEGRNQPPMQMAAIVWCALNRVDAGYGDIIHVVTAPGQFVGYSANNPVEEHILAIVNDVLTRWQRGGDGRVLPSDYLWFSAGNGENIFRNAFTNGTIWDWSLPNPYED